MKNGIYLLSLEWSEIQFFASSFRRRRPTRFLARRVEDI
jgi:hypothetical protein